MKMNVALVMMITLMTVSKIVLVFGVVIQNMIYAVTVVVTTQVVQIVQAHQTV